MRPGQIIDRGVTSPISWMQDERLGEFFDVINIGTMSCSVPPFLRSLDRRACHVGFSFTNHAAPLMKLWPSPHINVRQRRVCCRGIGPSGADRDCLYSRKPALHLQRNNADGVERQKITLPLKNDRRSREWAESSSWLSAFKARRHVRSIDMPKPMISDKKLLDRARRHHLALKNRKTGGGIEIEQLVTLTVEPRR